MFGNEGIQMSKMAIAVLLVCLLVGSTVSFFYMMYDNTDQRVKKMEEATNSSDMERLYELADLTTTNGLSPDELPLVTNVVSALTSFSEDSLLYIYVIPPADSDECTVYVYDDATTVESAEGVHKNVSNIPVTYACRQLLQYSNSRCEVRLYNVNSMTGVHIAIQNTGV